MSRVYKYSVEECTAMATETLQKNDRSNDVGGAFTVPTDRLYPHQWNWDSAFVALGWKEIDERRAWAELRTLLDAQWPDGMVPHIIYHSRSETYFPDLDRWGKTPTGNSSGFTQNPVAASCVKWLLEGADDDAYARNEAATLLPKLNKWHQWFFDHRRDAETGAIAIAHPWESRDNACDWDVPLAAVDTSNVPKYTRKDLLLVDAQQRPTPLHYQQFLSLVEAGKANGWQLSAENMPFWVADPFIMAILIAAEYDLALLSDELGQQAIAIDARARATQLEAGMESLWVESAQAYRAYDLLAGQFATHNDIGAFLPLCGGIADANTARAGIVIDQIERWLARVEFAVPSHDPESAMFESQRYWRGPIWLVVNLMIATGLRRFGRDDLALKIGQDGHRLIRASGFKESFDPVHGSGLGGDHFSWTAAMWLYWLKDNA